AAGPPRRVRTARLPRRGVARRGDVPRRARPARPAHAPIRSRGMTHHHSHAVGGTRPHGHDHAHGGGGHGHSHRPVERSIVRSREGLKAVSLSLAVLASAAVAQTVIFAASGSVALLADLVHNVGDALTAVPLGIAFLLRSFRAEKLAGLAVVGAIFVS